MTRPRSHALDWQTFALQLPTVDTGWQQVDDSDDARGTRDQLPRWSIRTAALDGVDGRAILTTGVAWQLDERTDAGSPIIRAAIRLAPGAPTADGPTVRAAVAALADAAPDWFGLDG